MLAGLVLHGCKRNAPAPDAGDNQSTEQQISSAPKADPARADAWNQMLRAEKLIRQLSRRLKAMKRSVLNLQLPDAEGRGLLAQSVAYRDIASQEPTGGRQLDQLEITQRKWPLAEQEERATSDDLRLWDPLLRQVDYFHYAKFKLAQGNFLDSFQALGELATRSDKG